MDALLAIVVGALVGGAGFAARVDLDRGLRAARGGDRSQAAPWFTAAAVACLCVSPLIFAGVVTPTAVSFAPLAVVLGGALFGVGVALARLSPLGALYHMGAGRVLGLVFFVAMALSAALFAGGSLTGVLRGVSSVGAVTLPTAADGGATLAVALILALVLFAAGARLAQGGDSLKLQAAGAALGAAAAGAWVLRGDLADWGVDGLRSAAAVAYAASGSLTASFEVDAAIALGAILGAGVMALREGELRPVVPGFERLIRAAVGGLLVGAGAAFAGHDLLGATGSAMPALHLSAPLFVCIAVLAWWLADSAIPDIREREKRTPISRKPSGRRPGRKRKNRKR